MRKLIHRSDEIRRDEFDDDYLFYDDGTIEHHYDKFKTDCNRIEVITADKIPDRRIESIIKKCPEEIKETIKKMLNVK